MAKDMQEYYDELYKTGGPQAIKQALRDAHEIKSKKLDPFVPLAIDTLHRGKGKSKRTSFKKGGPVR